MMLSSSTVAMCMSMLTTLAWTVGGKAPCEVRTEWGGNACNLGGSLYVKSKLGDEVSKDKCDIKYNKLNFAEQPFVKYPTAVKGETYTLVMIDPDAPNHPEGRYFLHWIMANIPGEDLAQGDLKNGKPIVGYVPPTPPKGTGTHRYMFVVFRHDDSAAKLTETIPNTQRRQWSLADWLDRQTVKLCGPLSGVQFTADFGAGTD